MKTYSYLTESELRAFLLSIVLIVAQSERCEKLDVELWKPCIDVGYTQTTSIPLYMNKTKLSLQFHEMRAMYNSSCAGDVLDMMMCSFFVPQCNGDRAEPVVLPCRRVCTEYLHTCKDKLGQKEVDMMSGPCSILPNESGNSNKCLEPKNFTPSPNAHEILDGKCHKILLPMCKQKYTHTVLSPEEQKKLYVRIYEKNYTDSVEKAKSTEYADLIKQELANHTECRVSLALTLCAEFLPPCFPSDKGRAYYTVCKTTCKNLWHQCPKEFAEYNIKFYCEHMADGESPTGFCKHTEWPSMWRLFPANKADKGKTPVVVTKTPHRYGWVAAAVLVPVVLALLVIGAVFYWKRYRLRQTAGYKPQVLVNDPATGEEEL